MSAGASRWSCFGTGGADAGAFLAALAKVLVGGGTQHEAVAAEAGSDFGASDAAADEALAGGAAIVVVDGFGALSAGASCAFGAWTSDAFAGGASATHASHAVGAELDDLARRAVGSSCAWAA